jgi:hypothetical protein
MRHKYEETALGTAWSWEESNEFVWNLIDQLLESRGEGYVLDVLHAAGMTTAKVLSGVVDHYTPDTNRVMVVAPVDEAEFRERTLPLVERFNLGPFGRDENLSFTWVPPELVEEFRLELERLGIETSTIKARRSIWLSASDFGRFLLLTAPIETIAPRQRTMPQALLAETTQMNSSLSSTPCFGLQHCGSEQMLWCYSDSFAYSHYATIDRSGSNGIVLFTSGRSGLRLCEEAAHTLLLRDQAAFPYFLFPDEFLMIDGVPCRPQPLQGKPSQELLQQILGAYELTHTCEYLDEDLCAFELQLKSQRPVLKAAGDSMHWECWPFSERVLGSPWGVLQFETSAHNVTVQRGLCREYRKK